MGGTRYGADDWKKYASTASAAATSSVHDTFKSRDLDPYLDPKGITVRESRDSDANPNSTALIIACDVTGSMGRYAHDIVKDTFGVIIKEVYDRKPISDPHIMFMAIGDVYCDQAPLQVSQFEADIKIIEQLLKVWIEGGGGGNNTESYDLPWYFAAEHTSIDCWEKRQKKGYLFTMGDEESPAGLTKEQIKQFLGDDAQGDYTAEQLLRMVEKKYHVFHIIIGQGSHACSNGSEVKRSWLDLMGQRAIWLDDASKLGELIISTLQINEGAKLKDVAASWDGSTALVIENSLEGLSTITEATGIQIL